MSVPVNKIFSSPILKTTTCGSLLQELQKIWDEIGLSDTERDKMLLQLEQECLDVYRRKVEKASKYKADLHQALAEADSEVANLVSALGEQASISRVKGTLKDQISAIKPVLEDLRRKKDERVKEFQKIQSQIVQLLAQLAGNAHHDNSSDPQVDECDLTVVKLGELKSQLQELQREKTVRVQKVNGHISCIHELCIVMSVDFFETINKVYPSLSDSAHGQPKSISNDTLARLAAVVHSLKQEKQQRLRKLQDLGSTLVELWNLMDTPVDEQNVFHHVTCLICSSTDEISSQGCLALDVIEKTELEVQRLNIVKASKMKELVLKKQKEIEEIYKGVHVDVDSNTEREILNNIIDSGNVDLSDLLAGMDDQIIKAKEQALSRKDILEKMEKWKFAVEEEAWLENYERDQNRYSAGRGAHKNLKRAEKARTLVSKIPSLVENLKAKVIVWEEDKGIQFMYDKVPLLETLRVYNVSRQEREEEKRKTREKKRLQEQHVAEQETLYGTKPSPMRALTSKKPLGQINSNTVGGTPGRHATTPLSRHGISAAKERRDKATAAPIPVNYVALPKDDPPVSLSGLAADSPSQTGQFSR
ncbi:65-kDa microtubule-associated protein 5-like isoform X1 [Papaver somniferum]|uniref:65-kDa microtubule-associated protein 5-like isoform X1 n=1 Tax=Papaver somniferum TaxID=3469 RepID=UPI000E6F8E4F|nr:65-kDa microtubule-associated protein 5-like isoform X1 [Papaver somniferum]